VNGCLPFLTEGRERKKEKERRENKEKRIRNKLFNI
jgi:hypothetical protein